MKTIGKGLRTSGRVITVIGLLMFYGSIVFAFSFGGGPPTAVSRAALILPAVGCVWLFGCLLWPPSRRGSMAPEVALGILSLPAGLVALFEIYGDELTPSKTFWVVVTIFLLPGAIALIVQAARRSWLVKRMVERAA